MSSLSKLLARQLRAGSIICMILTLCNCGPTDENTRQVERRNITEAVYASATILPVNYYNVFPEVAGIVEKKWVEAGDTVIAGQALFRIRNQVIDLQSANALLALQQAEEEIKGNSRQLIELEQQVALTKQQLEKDSTDYFRQLDLWKKNIGSKQQVERYELAYNNARIRLQSAVDVLSRSKEVLQNQLDQAKNNYQISTNNRQQFIVLSRLNGLVYETTIEEGETVGPNLVMAKLGLQDSFLVDMQIDERDISRIKIGQQVILHLDSYPGEVFEAEVSKIYPVMDTRSQSFRVEAVFSYRPSVLYPNLTCEANIVVHTLENVLVIPRSYLLPQDSVYLEEGQKVGLKTGISDLEYVQVLSGLEEGNTIYPPK